MMNRIIISVLLLLIHASLAAQNQAYWQQQVDYTMDIDMNVENFRYDGSQKLVYTNNSPDTLKMVFYHLQFNAFQPDSEMDTRLKNILDPDSRMAENKGTREAPNYQSRIADLDPDEIGYLKVLSLKQEGKPVPYEVSGTIMQVMLNEAIVPGGKTTFAMEFQGQVPVHIRRAGRNNAEGVALSMAQWYPKLAEYDFEGWHANAYLAREFHGVWGDFDVTIHIDRNYTIGGTGYLQNPQEVGHGYEDPDKELHLPTGEKLTWHFKAPRVHDFTWAADPEYVHDKIQGENDVTLHFFYKNDPEIRESWKKLQPKAAELLAYFNDHIGPYPYEQYSIIQAGDGGMEYGMCTFITGSRGYQSLVGVTAHEFAHNWFQFVLASNETKHAWMDEGFTEYISDLAMNEVMQQGKENPHAGSYNSYFMLARSGMEEPLSTFSDRYETNFSYGISAYSKGCLFLSQLGYVIGAENLERTIKQYYRDFQFRHPTPNNFKRTAEKVSGIQLEWYLNYWTQTTKTIDYAVSSVNGATIELERIGSMPMPLDLEVTFTDGTTESFHIPLVMMYGHKPTEAKVLESWSWVNPKYSFDAAKEVKSVRIDPREVMADVNRENNSL